MDFLASLFVGKPLNILIITAIFFLVYLILRFLVNSVSLHAFPFLLITTAWGIYAAWEWLVITKSPEAKISEWIFL